ncbi:hypothetical protein CYMTET_8013 [Cymbomonas tetramitiformis]|uniref:Uncharacterized protein n=1 Tax=Cymbomonas tetramitiformis TaxID=36881 RepID=A0AAE0GUI6_9CHLO|nr:hypothetical protein CYMTET_8013 [Cymbomonas tetramitiformis]
MTFQKRESLKSSVRDALGIATDRISFISIDDMQTAPASSTRKRRARVLLDEIGSLTNAVIVLTEISGFLDASESRSAMDSLQRASDTGALTTIAVNNGLANEGISMDETASAVIKVTSGSVAAGNSPDRSETQSSISGKKDSWIFPAVICAAASALLLMAIVGIFAWRHKRAAADSVTSHQQTTRPIIATAGMVANTTTPRMSSTASSSDDEQVPATDQQSRKLRTTSALAANMMLRTNEIKQQDQVRRSAPCTGYLDSDELNMLPSRATTGPSTAPERQVAEARLHKEPKAPVCTSEDLSAESQGAEERHRRTMKVVESYREHLEPPGQASQGLSPPPA